MENWRFAPFPMPLLFLVPGGRRRLQRTRAGVTASPARWCACTGAGVRASGGTESAATAPPCSFLFCGQPTTAAR